MIPQLSILIPSTPSRWDMTRVLYDNLQEKCQGKDVEILLFLDNKKRTIGEKREALKNMANGKFICFNDSDDEFTSIDKIYEATFLDVDVITFDARCYNQDGSIFIVNQQLGHPVEHNNDGNGNYLDSKRPPFPNCAWHHKFKKYSYPDINFGEDWVWVEQCLQEAKTEYHINEVLFSYNFDAQKTEANTESNPYWTNPNHESDSQL